MQWLPNERHLLVKINFRNETGQFPDKVHRRLLPFYMRPTVLVAFMAISLVGQIVWITAVTIVGEIDMWWCSFGFAIGIVLGYIHGKWIARMWGRDYLRVLKREITFWQAKGGKGTSIFMVLALGIPIFFAAFVRLSVDSLAGLQSYIFGFIGGTNFAVFSWVRQLPK